MLQLIFARKHALGSYIIRFFTFSSWSHVGLLFPDGKVLDVTLSTGVRLTQKEEFLKGYSKTSTWNVEVADESATRLFAEKQVGKSYDLSGIFGLIFQRKWQEDDSWFCSELVEASLQAGGLKRFRDEVYRITPQQSWAHY